MTRSLVGLSVAFVALLVGITAFKRWGTSGAGSVDVMEAGRRASIRAFWEHYHAATAARGRGDFGAAADGYRKALQMNPGHEDSLFYLAVCLQETGRYTEAADELHRLIGMHPASNRAYSQLGSLLATLAPGASPDLEGAAAAFERNAEINREESGPFARKGLLALARGDLDAAHQAFILGAGGGAPEAMFLLGFTDYLRGRYRAASRTFVLVLEANAREKSITGRGVFSEGDVNSGPETMTAFERAGVKSLLFLWWSARRSGADATSVPEAFRVQPDELSGRRFVLENLPGDVSGRGSFVDLDRHGPPELLITGRERLQLLRRLAGSWRDATGEAGLGRTEPAWDAIAFDAQGDGWSDLYLLRAGYIGTGSNRFYWNDRGRFREEVVGLGGRRATARALPVDVNGDGRTDIVEVGNASADAPSVRVFINEGSRWVDRAAALSIRYEANAVDAAVADFEGDGKTDIFILGWKSPGRLFRNEGTRFTDVTVAAGLGDVGGDGLSVLAFDYNVDGRPDLLVTAQAPYELSLRRILSPSLTTVRGTPRLFRNLGQGRFEELTEAVGLNRPYNVAQVMASDFDGDGWPDLLFAHGGLERERIEPSVVLRNDEGRSFLPWAYVPSVDEPGNAIGTAVADIDMNGRPDIFLSGAGVLRHRGR